MACTGAGFTDMLSDGERIQDPVPTQAKCWRAATPPSNIRLASPTPRL
jgi:hypothetical protein